MVPIGRRATSNIDLDCYRGRRRTRPVPANRAYPCASGPSALAIGLINRSTEEERRVQVLVRDNNVDQALRVLKKKMQREGIFREMKLRGHYENPSDRKRKPSAAPASSRARNCSARACYR